jgi:hypothetical protein
LTFERELNRHSARQSAHHIRVSYPSILPTAIPELGVPTEAPPAPGCRTLSFQRVRVLTLTFPSLLLRYSEFYRINII